MLLSLDIGGIDRSAAAGYAQGAAHFLEGLGDIHLREDAMVIHDASRIPGLDRIGEVAGLAVQFRDRSGTKLLTVMNVNRTPIETTTGVDLIYYQHRLDAFVLVQYKRMHEENGRLTFRPSRDPNWAAELARMESLRRVHRRPASGRAYRLSAGPFFFKLCRPGAADHTSDDLIQGMYLPFEYWTALEASGQLRGPRGGTAITYGSVERWINNTLFVELVADGWVGSADASSALLAKVIRDSLRLGRSAVIAVASSSQ